MPNINFDFLADKILFELIAPVEQRIAAVKQFLGEIDSTITYDIVPIRDAFGPTKTDPKIDVGCSQWVKPEIDFCLFANRLSDNCRERRDIPGWPEGE